MVPMLDTPAPFVVPDDPLPVGPRPSGEREWQGRMERWGGPLGTRGIEGLWGLWCKAAESWLVGWTGKEDPVRRGRGRQRRIRRQPTEGQRGPVGPGEASRRAQGRLKAWRWLQDLSRAVTVVGPAAEVKVRRLVTLLAGTLPGCWSPAPPRNNWRSAPGKLSASS